MGLFRPDGKRPDGVTLVPWQSGKSLCWDVTVTCPLAESYIDRVALEAGAVASCYVTNIVCFSLFRLFVPRYSFYVKSGLQGIRQTESYLLVNNTYEPFPALRAGASQPKTL